VTNVYNHTVVNNVTVNRVSYNGGVGGIHAEATAREQAAISERHSEQTTAQFQHVNQAQNNPQLRVANNGGRPAIAATSRPGQFSNAVAAHSAGGPVNTAMYKQAAANPNNGRAPQSFPQNNAAGNRPAYNSSMVSGAKPSDNNQIHASAPNNTAHPETLNSAQRPAENAPRMTSEQNRYEAQQYHPQTQQPKPENQQYHAQAQPRPETPQYHAQAQQPRPEATPHYSQPQHEPQQPHAQAEPPHSQPHEQHPQASHENNRRR
jgi:hypothetical protein